MSAASFGLSFHLVGSGSLYIQSNDMAPPSVISQIPFCFLESIVLLFFHLQVLLVELMSRTVMAASVDILYV